MAFDVKTFMTRTGSAILFAIIMLSAMLWKLPAFLLLFLAVTVIGLREYASILEKILHTTFSAVEKNVYYFIGVTTYFLVSLLPIFSCDDGMNSLSGTWLYYVLGLWIGAIVIFIFLKKQKASWFLLTGISYVALSLGILVQLRIQSLLLPLLIIFMIWTNDTMAYITGSFIGKNKLMPSVSPKKTIEGTLGGILFTFLVALLWQRASGFFTGWNWAILAFIASIAGTIGDLIESKLKRMAGVKDSGSIMPGHGGILDRFDSLLFVAPVAFLYTVLFMKCFPYTVF